MICVHFIGLLLHFRIHIHLVYVMFSWFLIFSLMMVTTIDLGLRTQTLHRKDYLAACFYTSYSTFWMPLEWIKSCVLICHIK